MADSAKDLEFPVWGLLPKKETEVTSFLNKYPTYDGRDTVIAIFDSGVDPGAPGLQTTSDGKVKVVHRFDCSGCGDVNTSTIVQATDNIITGLTGRKLTIPTTWINPSNNYRIGVKNAYDLYPERLQERISGIYKEKKWDEDHRKATAEANRNIATFDANHTTTNLSEVDKLSKEDLDAKVDILNNSEKKFTDSGPVYDCVLFHDGEKWQCCIDTTEEGSLDQCPVLREYSLFHDFAPLTSIDQLNFSMNVHDDGNLLELVGLCSSHGTHVASIASAYFPDCPQECGVAPGAQIVSFSIGDGRLKGMETGTAIVRAIIKLMELSKHSKIQVINMSYGEHAHYSDAGRIGELMNEVVNKYGVVWVASAGNRGPALSTIGTPPDISQETIIGVGAYVSPDMMVAAYSMRQKLPGMPYTWSSRGPCIDGGIGVTTCAPGGAVTSVPNCILRYSQLMNGTSMASPHVAGAVSIMLSGLIHQQLPYTPYSVKRAIENTAHVLQGVEVFAQGSGLLQVDRCFNYLVNYHSVIETNIRFQIACGLSNSKGIHLRSKPITPTSSHNITIEPFFFDSDNVPNYVKIKFNMKLALVCDASYVNCPTHLDISNSSRVFAVKIDTTELPTGVHNTFIEAFDVNCVKKGPVFKVPITIIQPQEVNNSKHRIVYNSVHFKPNTIKRDFYVVPHFATWAVLRMSTSDLNGIGRFVVHAMHILSKQSCKTLEYNKAVMVTSSNDTILSFQVRSNVVLEVAIAKYWANLGDLNLDYSFSFYGVKPNQPAITMHAADGIHCVEVTSLQGEEIIPSISFKNSVQVLKVTEGKVLPLTLRDVIPPNRQIYELALVYNFSITKSTDVTPNLSYLSNVLYESEFESQLWMLYDSNKQLLGCGDAYPSKYFIKVDKGDYTIRLHVRHDKKEYLDKLMEVPLLLQQKLSNAISLDVYSSLSQALISGKKAVVAHGVQHNALPFYITPLANDKFVVKSNNPAQMLTGYITYCKDDIGKKVDTYPFKYILFDGATKKTNGNSNSSSDKSKYDEYNESIRDVAVQHLSKMDVTTAEKLYEEMIITHPNHLPFHTSYLQVLDPLDAKRAFPPIKINGSCNKDLQRKIITICEKVLEFINEDSLLTFIATKTDLRSDATKIKITMEQQKNVFLECLCRTGISLCRLYVLENTVDLLEEIAKIWKRLVRFVDPTDSKVVTSYVIYFVLWHSKAYKQYGRLLKYTLRIYEDKPNKDIEEKVMQLCKLNEWEHMANHIGRNMHSKFPSAFKSF